MYSLLSRLLFLLGLLLTASSLTASIPRETVREIVRLVPGSLLSPTNPSLRSALASIDAGNLSQANQYLSEVRNERLSDPDLLLLRTLELELSFTTEKVPTAGPWDFANQGEAQIKTLRAEMDRIAIDAKSPLRLRLELTPILSAAWKQSVHERQINTAIYIDASAPLVRQLATMPATDPWQAMLTRLASLFERPGVILVESPRSMLLNPAFRYSMDDNLIDEDEAEAVLQSLYERAANSPSLSREEQARFSILSARHSHRLRISTPQLQERWSKALHAAQGTRHEEAARIEAKLSAIVCGTAFTLPEASAVPVKTLLAEVSALELRTATLPSADQETLVLREACHSLAETLKEPKLVLSSRSTVMPEDPVEVAYGFSGMDSAELCLYEVPPFARITSSFRDEGDEHDLAESLGTRPDASLPLPECRLDLTVGPDADEWHNAKLRLLEKAPAGVRLIVLRGKRQGREYVRFRRLTVTTLGVIMLRKPSGEATAYLSTGREQRPMANEAVTLLIQQREGAPLRWAGATDKEGRLEIPFTALGVQGYRAVQFAWRGHVANLSTYEPPEAPTLKAELMTDRPIYRPGDTVRWRVLLREWQGCGWHVPSRPISFRFSSGESILFKVTSATPDQDGILDGDFMIPQTVAPGAVFLDFDKAERAFTTRIRTPDFMVGHYVPPPAKASLALTSDSRNACGGSRLRLRATVNWVSGGAIPGVPLTLRIAAMHTAGGEAPGQAFLEWSRNVQKKELYATSGKDGTAEFHLTLPDEIPGKLDIFARLSATPQGIESINTTAHVVASPSSLHVRPASGALDNAWIPLGEPLRLDFILQDATGNPSETPLKARWIERRPSKRWSNPEGKIAESLTRPEGKDWTLLNSVTLSLPGPVHDITPGPDGRFTVDFPPAWQGTHELSLRAYEKDVGVPSENETPWTLCVVNEAAPAVEINGDKLSIIPPLVMKAGTAPSLLVCSAAPDTDAVLALSGHTDSTLQRVRLQGKCTLLRLPDFPSNSGQVMASLHLLQYGSRSSEAACRITLPARHQPLDITLTSSAANARPGELVTLVTTVKKSDGAPATGVVTLASYDSGLNTLLPVVREPRISFDDIIPAIPLRESRFSPPLNWENQNQDSAVDIPEDTRPGIRVHARILDECFSNPTRTRSLRGFKLTNVFGLVEKTGYLAIPADRGIRGHGAGLPGFGRGGVQVTVRRDFKETALWIPRLQLDAQGRASTSFRLPDNLTNWQVDAYAASGASPNSFGRARTWINAELPLQARLLLPRRLTEGDSCAAAAVIVNSTDIARVSKYSLHIEGAQVHAPGIVSLPAQGLASIRLPLRATSTGTIPVLFQAGTDSDADGAEGRVPVFPDTAPVLKETLLTLDGDKHEINTSIDIPDGVLPGTASLHLCLDDGTLSAVAAAIPYLLDYPHACAEQTTSRYAPLAVLRRLMLERGMTADEIDHIFLAPAAERAARQVALGRPSSPSAVARDFNSFRTYMNGRLSDCGTGWWPNTNKPAPWMVSYAMLMLSYSEDTPTHQDFLSKYASEHWFLLMQSLREAAKEGTPRSLQAFMLAAYSRSETKAQHAVEAPLTLLTTNLDTLDDSALCPLSIAIARLGSPEAKASVLARLLARARTTPDAGGLACWGDDSTLAEPSHNAVECTSLALLGLGQLAPEHPAAAAAARWLLLKRQGPHWASTRQTALAALALTEHLRTAKARTAANEGETTVEVRLAGKPLLQEGRPLRLTFVPSRITQAGTTIPLPPTSLKAGKNILSLARLSGNASLNATCTVSLTSRMDSIPAMANACTLSVELQRKSGLALLNGGYESVTAPLSPSSPLQVNDQACIRISITVPTALQHLMLTVPRAAGLEPINPLGARDVRLQRPGTRPSDGKGARNNATMLWRDEYDDRSVIFIDSLEAGDWEITLPLRAQFAGDFRVPPATLESMYVPEIRANTAATRLRIGE